MAFVATITYRAALTTQALGTLGASPEWDRALGEYLRREALDHADGAFGRTYEIQNEIGLKKHDFQDNRGEGYTTTPAMRVALDELINRGKEQDALSAKQFMMPHLNAAIELAKTPAPTLAAALFKVMLIDVEDLMDVVDADDDLMGIVQADMDRLAVTEAA